jgi:hypothetical protein
VDAHIVDNVAEKRSDVGLDEYRERAVVHQGELLRVPDLAYPLPVRKPAPGVPPPFAVRTFPLDVCNAQVPSYWLSGVQLSQNGMFGKSERTSSGPGWPPPLTAPRNAPSFHVVWAMPAYVSRG